MDAGPSPPSGPLRRQAPRPVTSTPSHKPAKKAAPLPPLPGPPPGRRGGGGGRPSVAAGAGGRAALSLSVTDTAGRAGLAAPVKQVPGSQAYFTPGSSDGDSRGPCPGPSCARTGPDQPTLEALVPGGGTTQAALGASCPREAGVRRASAQAPSPPGPVARGPRAVEGGGSGASPATVSPRPEVSHSRASRTGCQRAALLDWEQGGRGVSPSVACRPTQ